MHAIRGYEVVRSAKKSIQCIRLGFAGYKRISSDAERLFKRVSVSSIFVLNWMKLTYYM